MISKWDRMYISLAERIAQESHAVKLKVGAVFVSPNGVMSTGINGLPAGGSNVCEDRKYMDQAAGGWHGVDEIELQWPTVDSIGRYYLKTKPEVSHAEEALFSKLMRQGVSTVGGTIYITTEPCTNCAKIIVGSGVIAVKYKNSYIGSNGSGVEWLKQNGITVEQID